MIEINLLPPQYRTVERTPLPIFLGLIGGIVLVAVTGLYLVALTTKTQTLQNEQLRLVAIREAKAKEVEDIRKIERELQESQGRIDTVLGIAESKLYWAHKMEQLARLLPRQVWLDSLNFDGSRLSLACKARGTSLQRYTAFRQDIRNNTNFVYHFDNMPLTNIDVVNPGAAYLEPAVLSFQLPLTLRNVEQAGATGPRR
jgi:Tfp pilus assembly protein PilN